jgi:hypothetical protein
MMTNKNCDLGNVTNTENTVDLTDVIAEITVVRFGYQDKVGNY